MRERMFEKVKEVLKYSERFTKTDMLYLVEGGFWLIAGQAIAAITAFVFSLIVARYLSPDTYGSYKYVLSLATIIGAFSLTGLGTTIIRKVALGYDGALAIGFRTNLLWSTPMLLGFAGVAAYYIYFGAYALGSALIIAGICLPIINSAALFNAYWNGKKDFYRQTLYWTIANVFTTVITIGAVLVTEHIAILVSSYFISSAVIHLILYVVVVRGAKDHDERSGSTEELADAAHLSAMNFLNTVSGNIDKIIVFQLLGTTELAIYSFALAIPEQIRGTLKAGARLALPRFAERPLYEIQKNLQERVVRFSLLILGAAILYMISAPYIFRFLFPAYMEAVPYSQLFALTLFTALGSAPLAALQAHARNKALYQHSILTNIIQIVSSVVLIQFLGLWGAAIAVVVNRTVSLVLPLYLLRRGD